VRHLGKTVPSTQIFTPEVFTMDVLKELDEKVIKPHFLLPDLFDENELNDAFENESESNETLDEQG
jgi:hypothetical protein